MACTTLFSPAFDVANLRVEKRQNGFLVNFHVQKKIEEATAFITKDNWLVITIVGATVDFERLRAHEPDDLVSSVQIIGYKTSVQITLKLKDEFRSCELINHSADGEISVALFAR